MRETVVTATGGTGVEYHGGASDREPTAWAPEVRRPVSGFTSVDQSPDPGRLVRFLEDSATGLGAMKSYMATAHALRRPMAPVLDLGCGAGHDLALLADAAVLGLGVDPSRVMLRAAATRGVGPLVQARGEELPFASHVFAGSRIERVLMHVVEPAAVVAEVVRCVQPRGLLTVFEPDWSSLVVSGSAVPTNWVSNARHPSIGSLIGDLLSAAGCSVVDRVEERSWWSFRDFVRITRLEQSLERAVVAGVVPRATVQQWLTEQRRLADAGEFRAEIAKLLWVATTPA
jgi:SAM-dependent methyltransferase